MYLGFIIYPNITNNLKLVTNLSQDAAMTKTNLYQSVSWPKDLLGLPHKSQAALYPW